MTTLILGPTGQHALHRVTLRGTLVRYVRVPLLRGLRRDVARDIERQRVRKAAGRWVW
jgi:hypothetical protein